MNKLNRNDKKEIVAVLQSGKMTPAELAVKYGVNRSRMSQVFKEETGQSLKSYRTVKMTSRYRAWNKQERKMYEVWGIDWLDEKIKIKINEFAEWQSMSKFIIMQSSELRDKKRTPGYPAGQKIYAGDIVQFSINLDGKETEVKDVVVFDPSDGCFVVVLCDGDLLCMYNDECEVIGNLQENPELLGSDLQQIRALLKKHTFE